MGLNLGYRDLDPQQRVGGYHESLESLENYIRFLSFDCYVSQHCDRGWFSVPASIVEGSSSETQTA